MSSLRRGAGVVEKEKEMEMEMELSRIEEIPGRGRGVIAAKPLKGGQVILRDSPILLYSARPFVVLKETNDYCSHCYINFFPTTPPNSCPTCSSSSEKKVLFCSPECRCAALSSSHTPWVCQSLLRLSHHYPSWPRKQEEEVQIQARFLVAAYNLAVVSPSRFQTLLSLQGDAADNNINEATTSFLHSLFSSLCPPPPTTSDYSFCLELTASLLAKDKLNAFGLMEQQHQQEEGERSVRAYGIYPNASLFNHDCLPNACRFDYIDSTNTNTNTDIVIRMIHDVPQGREICLSYFPVNLNYRHRQQRLTQDYGFVCSCDRCLVEANWSDQEDEEGCNNVEEEENEDLAMDEDVVVMQVVGSDTEDGMVHKDDDFPHAYFFLRYMCTGKNCWGTLAPIPPSNGTPSPVMECNVCGNFKDDDHDGNQEEMDGDILLP